MYIVVKGREVFYMGGSAEEANRALYEHTGSCMSHVEEIEDVQRVLKVAELSGEDNICSLADEATNLFSQCADWCRDQQIVEKLKTGGESLLKEAGQMGSSGMKAVGEGLTALGEWLRRVNQKG